MKDVVYCSSSCSATFLTTDWFPAIHHYEGSVIDISIFEHILFVPVCEWNTNPPNYSWFPPPPPPPFQPYRSICLSLTLSQTTNSRLFQTQRVCRQQFQIWWKWQKVFKMGRKHILYTCKHQGLFGKGLRWGGGGGALLDFWKGGNRVIDLDKHDKFMLLLLSEILSVLAVMRWFSLSEIRVLLP